MHANGAAEERGEGEGGGGARATLRRCFEGNIDAIVPFEQFYRNFVRVPDDLWPRPAIIQTPNPGADARCINV